MGVGTKDLQRLLTAAGVATLKVDGMAGPATQDAVASVLRQTGGVPDSWNAARRRDFAAQWALRTLRAYAGDLDGLWGPASAAALEDWSAVKSGGSAVFERPVGQSPKSTEWPTYSSERAMVDFFGPRASHDCTAGRAVLPFPFRLAWDLNQTVSSIRCHVKVAPALQRIMEAAADEYGEARMRELRLDLFGGCFNDRNMRGGSKPSTHSWGVAVDLDPERNQLRWGKDRAEFAKREYLPFWKAVEAEGAVSLGRHADYDWMHFQFCVPA